MAIRSFILLILSILTPLFLAAFIFKQSALNTSYKPSPSPIMQTKKFVVAYQAGSGEQPANSWPAIENSLQQTQKNKTSSSQLWIWIDVHLSRDREIVLYGSNFLEEFTEGKGHISFKTLDELKQLNIGYNFTSSDGKQPYRANPIQIQTFADTLKKFPTAHFIVNVLSNTQLIDRNLQKIIKETNFSERIIFHSPFNVILKTLRKESPLSIFAMHSAEITRFFMFGAFTLEPTIPLDGDLFLSHSKRMIQRLEPSFLSEIHRRHKKAILGPIDNLAEWNSLKKKYSPNQLDGVVTRFPSKFNKQPFL